MSREAGREEVERYYDSLAFQYDSLYSGPYWELYDAITWRNMRMFLPKLGGRILDIGGGTGRWAIPLAEMGYEVVLTDISHKMLEVAEEKVKEKGLSNRIQIFKADAENMPLFEDCSFDMAIAQGDVLSYCQDPLRAAREALRMLKPGGHFIASVDNKFALLCSAFSEGDFLKVSSALREGRIEHQDEYGKFTIRAFSPDELRSLMERAGFEVVKLSGKTALWQLLPEKAKRKVLQEPEFLRHYLRLERELCTEPWLLGAAGHLEVVSRKPEEGTKKTTPLSSSPKP